VTRYLCMAPGCVLPAVRFCEQCSQSYCEVCIHLHFREHFRVREEKRKRKTGNQRRKR